MKKILVGFLSAALVLSLSACSDGGDEPADRPNKDKSSHSANANNPEDLNDPDKPDTWKELGIWDVLPEIEVTNAADFTYEYRSSIEGVCVTGYIGDAIRVRIPETFEGEPVTGVDLSGCKKELTELVMPDTVKSFSFSSFIERSLKYMNVPGALRYINDERFKNWNLVGVYISNGVTEIGPEAFSDCTNLVNVSIPNSVIIFSDDPFRNTPWLENMRKTNPLVIIHGILIDGETCSGNVTVPDGVTEISAWAFEGCTNLINITIPDSVTRIDCGAFSGCTSLTSAIIPNSITEISNYTFENCINLTKVTMPDYIFRIGGYAFDGCTNLTATYKGKPYDYEHINDLYDAINVNR